jgi:hypothetical protein
MNLDSCVSCFLHIILLGRDELLARGCVGKRVYIAAMSASSLPAIRFPGDPATLQPDGFLKRKR